MLCRLGGGEEQQQVFLNRALSSLHVDAEGDLQGMIGARAADTSKPFVTIRLGQTGKFHERCRQILFEEPAKLKKKLAQEIPTRSLTQAVQEAFTDTYPDRKDYIYYNLIHRADLSADELLAPVEEGMTVLLWVVLRNDTETGGTLCFGLHGSECDYGTAKSVGGNADFKFSFVRGPPRNNPLSIPDCPLFPGETGDDFVRWLRAQGGERNQALALACRRAHHAAQVYSEDGGGDKATLRQLELVALEANDALHTAKYTGPKSMLRVGIPWVMEAARYRFSYLERSSLLTFKVDGGGAETTVLVETVFKDPGQRVVMCACESHPGSGLTSPGSIDVFFTRLGPGTPRVKTRLSEKPLGELLTVPGVTNPDEQLTHVTVTDITFRYKRTSTTGKKWSRQSVKKELRPYQPAPLPLPGQGHAALPPAQSWFFAPDSFEVKFTADLAGTTQSWQYTTPVYTHALPALSDKLRTRAATLPPDTPCPWDLRTAAGLLEALEEFKMMKYMHQQHGGARGSSRFTIFVDWLKKKAVEELPLPGPSWRVAPDIFKLEYFAFVQGLPGASTDYTGPVYKHALPALSAELSSLAATSLPNTPCPYDLATAAGLLKTLEELKETEFVRQKKGGNAYKFIRFIRWLQKAVAEQGEEEDGPA